MRPDRVGLVAAGGRIDQVGHSEDAHEGVVGRIARVVNPGQMLVGLGVLAVRERSES